MNKKVDDSIAKSILVRLKQKEINYDTASILLGISKRQIYKLKKKFEFNGDISAKYSPPKIKQMKN